MRGHLHADQLAGSPRELVGDRVHFAGMQAGFLTGGAGFAAPDAPPNANALVVGGGPAAHVSVIAMVLVAVAVLFLLDKAGFRFAVTAGKR